MAGFLILFMIAITVANGLAPLNLPFNPLWIAGIAAWLAALLLCLLKILCCTDLTPARPCREAGSDRQLDRLPC